VRREKRFKSSRNQEIKKSRRRRLNAEDAEVGAQSSRRREEKRREEKRREEKRREEKRRGIGASERKGPPFLQKAQKG
jgi:hypothetical protein